MEMTEKTLASRYEFKGRIINTRVDEVLLPDGTKSSREVVEHNGGVGIIPLDDKGNVCLIRQYRHPYGEVIYEIPAGKLEKGENPLDCGMRELREETGYTAQKWQDIGVVYPTPGYCAEKIYLYMATELSLGETDFDDGEFIESHLVPLAKAVEMVMSGEIKDSKTQIAILKLNAIKEDKPK